MNGQARHAKVGSDTIHLKLLYRRTHALGREVGWMRAKRSELMFARGVEQDHPSHIARITVGIQAHIQSANGMSHQKIGTVYLCMPQQEMQFCHYLLAGARARPALTPAIARSIIRADALEACHCWLNLAPIKRGSPQSRIENHRWTACAGTVDMKPVAPDIHEFAGRRIVICVNRARNSLIGQPDQQKSYKGQTAYAQQTQETPFDGPTWA